MPQKTDLNVSPYYDDHSSSDNFVKTLFRPGFAIQARELTQLQSQLQSQIEAQGTHIFQEGAMVIPGQLMLNTEYHSLKLASTFSGETIDPSQYYSTTTPVTITGGTTGVTAVVIGYDAATTTDQPTLYLRYVKTGTDTFIKKFADGENISADAGITHTTAYSSDAASATTYTSSYSEAAGSTVAQLNGSTGPAAGTAAAAIVQAGIYYIRGFFVECTEQTLIIDKYETKVSARIGFTVTETLTTPEDDTSLLDNATGSTNYAAKGAHRLKYTLTLAKLDLGSEADSSFIELMQVDSGVIDSLVYTSAYNILEKTITKLVQLTSLTTGYHVWFGPCICKSCHEINPKTHKCFDLITENKTQALNVLPKKENQLIVSNICTACNGNSEFYSYRADHHTTRRNLAMIGLF